MQLPMSASFAATVPSWLKTAARTTFVLAFIKSVVWLGAWWLAFRGFETF